MRLKSVSLSIVAIVLPMFVVAQQPEKIIDFKQSMQENSQGVSVKYQRAELPSNFMPNGISGDLKADFSVKSDESGTIAWSENFDSKIDGWTLTSSNASTTQWIKKSDLSAAKKFTQISAEDVASLYIEGHYRLPKETAYATSPILDVPANGQLKFHMGYSLNFSSYCSLNLNISVNGGAFTELWNTTKGPQSPLEWVWRPISLDISQYAGKKVQLQWQFNGYMGNFALDGITLSGVKSIASVSVKTGEQIQFKSLSTGSSLSYVWQFPGGTPESSTEMSPSVYYKRDGVYDVSLSVSDGTNSDRMTKSAFVVVTGNKPKADILPPATFRSFTTRFPYIAPLSPVQFKDNSKGFPTEWTWAFTGIGLTGGVAEVVTEENPLVGYSFMGNQTVSLYAANKHGVSDTTMQVTVGYSAPISNFRVEDVPFTFQMSDGMGTFPGSNTLKITDYAEKFSKPSKPMLIYGVYAYFTKAMALELYEQLQSVTVKVCKSENGLPGATIESASWFVFELDVPSGDNMVPTPFEFSKPVVMDEEFFIVISGIPAKSDIVDVQMATAKFRSYGNTAYLNTRDGWKAACDYFPAGNNHTSIMVVPMMAHSVIYPFVESNTIRVEKAAGTTAFPLFSYLGYKTPITIEGDAWCRVTSVANGLTLDTIDVAFDRLPDNLTGRTAVIKLTDGLQTVSVELVQGVASDVTELRDNAGVSCYPNPVKDVCNIISKEKMESVVVYDLSGKLIEMHEAVDENTISLNTSQWLKGIYLIAVKTGTSFSRLKVVK